MDRDGGFANAALAGEDEDDVLDVVEAHSSVMIREMMNGVVQRLSLTNIISMQLCQNNFLAARVAVQRRLRHFQPYKSAILGVDFRRVRVVFRLERLLLASAKCS